VKAGDFSDAMVQRVLRPIKAFATRTGLMPKTMAGKKLLKRMVFGKLIPMPAELQAGMMPFSPPTPISADHPDIRHKVVYCAAGRNGEKLRR
jgi:hypothetical protein